MTHIMRRFSFHRKEVTRNNAANQVNLQRNCETADRMNKHWGVTKAQEPAILPGAWLAGTRLYGADRTIKHMKKPDEPKR